EAAVPRRVWGGVTRPTRVRASHAGAREGDAIDRRLRLTPARERVPTESNAGAHEPRQRRTVEPPRGPTPAGRFHRSLRQAPQPQVDVVEAQRRAFAGLQLD